MNPPKEIHIRSDGNVLEFVEVKKPSKGEPTYVYKYIKSISKMDELLALNEKELEKIISTNQ